MFLGWDFFGIPIPKSRGFGISHEKATSDLNHFMSLYVSLSLSKLSSSIPHCSNNSSSASPFSNFLSNSKLSVNLGCSDPFCILCGSVVFAVWTLKISPCWNDQTKPFAKYRSRGKWTQITGSLSHYLEQYPRISRVQLDLIHLSDYRILGRAAGMQIRIWRSKFPPPIHCARSTWTRSRGRNRSLKMK